MEELETERLFEVLREPSNARSQKVEVLALLREHVEHLVQQGRALVVLIQGGQLVELVDDEEVHLAEVRAVEDTLLRHDEDVASAGLLERLCDDRVVLAKLRKPSPRLVDEGERRDNDDDVLEALGRHDRVDDEALAEAGRRAQHDALARHERVEDLRLWVVEDDAVEFRRTVRLEREQICQP